jgi:PIN domain nuclease of toxin-antitoxin system
MTHGQSHTIVVGLSLDPRSGQANVDPALTETLLDLAEALGDLTGLPVDIEHVVAAVALAARDEQLSPDTRLSAEDTAQRAILLTRVRQIFHQYDGQVGAED